MTMTMMCLCISNVLHKALLTQPTVKLHPPLLHVLLALDQQIIPLVLPNNPLHRSYHQLPLKRISAGETGQKRVSHQIVAVLHLPPLLGSQCIRRPGSRGQMMQRLLDANPLLGSQYLRLLGPRKQLMQTLLDANNLTSKYQTVFNTSSTLGATYKILKSNQLRLTNISGASDIHPLVTPKLL